MATNAPSIGTSASLMQKTRNDAQGVMEDGRGDNDAKMQKKASQLGNDQPPLTRVQEHLDIPHSEGGVPAARHVPAVHAAGGGVNANQPALYSPAQRRIVVEGNMEDWLLGNLAGQTL